MAGREDWARAAEADSADDLREKILTGFRTGKPFTPYVPTLSWPPVTRVLDFGCGLGRSFPWLRTVAPAIVGFDLPPMITRCRALLTEPVEALRDDWAAVRDERFDLIHASLVLQHIETEVVRSALADFARMAPAIYVLTRTDTDFGVNLFDLIAERAELVPGECHEVDHDPADAPAWVLARHLRRGPRVAGAGRHFEVMLGSGRASGVT
ncbi:MAG: class I SAM-dependent methyltransferase [Vicinamibacterales bacterium]